MEHTDDDIVRYLEGRGWPWSAYVLLDGRQLAVRATDGRLMSVIVDDDKTCDAIASFLLRMGQVLRVGDFP